MTKIAQNMTGLIGSTPLVKVNKMADGAVAEVVAKLEFYNPGGSVKDRPALSMIEAAEKEGVLDSETIIIEPTSGNTGVGLALVAAVKGYKLILTMPESMSIERRKLLKKFGAELVLTPASDGMKGAIAKAQEIAEKHTKSFIPQQFKNKNNPDAHYRTTAQEILDDTDGLVDVFVAGVGTGGTITGVGHHLKKKQPGVKIVAVEPLLLLFCRVDSRGLIKFRGLVPVLCRIFSIRRLLMRLLLWKMRMPSILAMRQHKKREFFADTHLALLCGLP